MTYFQPVRDAFHAWEQTQPQFILDLWNESSASGDDLASSAAVPLSRRTEDANFRLASEPLAGNNPRSLKT